MSQNFVKLLRNSLLIAIGTTIFLAFFGNLIVRYMTNPKGAGWGEKRAYEIANLHAGLEQMFNDFRGKIPAEAAYMKRDENLDHSNYSSIESVTGQPKIHLCLLYTSPSPRDA